MYGTAAQHSRRSRIKTAVQLIIYSRYGTRNVARVVVGGLRDVVDSATRANLTRVVLYLFFRRRYHLHCRLFAGVRPSDRSRLSRRGGVARLPHTVSPLSENFLRRTCMFNLLPPARGARHDQQYTRIATCCW